MNEILDKTLPYEAHIKAEVFYYVNYVNVNYSIKNSTVDFKYRIVASRNTSRLVTPHVTN